MSKENERLNNVRRLAYRLYAADAATVKRLATMLHYQPEQLRKDILDMETYTHDKVQGDRAETYKGHTLSHAPLKILSPLPLKPCKICQSSCISLYKWAILNANSVCIKCENCGNKTKSNSYNCGRYDKTTGKFRPYTEQEAITDICNEWNMKENKR